ncbi:MAG: copper amine oxidase N-terminal domain-containing protein [Candidatus Pristimantibacillus sp.]
MLKKLTVTLLASAMLAVPIFSAPSLANSKPIELNNGIMKNSRVLIPLRDVSQNLDASVKWNQQLQTITIKKDDTEMVLTVNSKKVLVNQSEMELDVPTQLIQNTTFVPLRFISQTLGADIDWNQYGYQATITLNGKQIVVNVIRPQPSSAQKASIAHMKLLSDKLNEAADVSSIKQIRTHFKPYFTDRLIHSIIQDKGLLHDYQFNAPLVSPNYTSKTTARLLQSLDIGHDAWETHSVNRSINLVYVNGVWKVDSVNFSKTSVPISGA